VTRANASRIGAGGGERSPPSVSTPGGALPLGVESEVADWIALLKPRVMSLVVYSGAIGLLVAPGRINPVLGFAAILCIAVAAGACGAINMWYDRDIDAVMRRTAERPDGRTQRAATRQNGRPMRSERSRSRCTNSVRPCRDRSAAAARRRRH